MHQQVELLERKKNNFITLSYAKQYLRVEHSQDDEMIQEMLQAVLEVAENYLSLTLSLSSWKLTIHDYLPRVIKLLKAPILNIVQFKIFRGSEASFLTKDHYCLDKFIGSLTLYKIYITQKAEITYQTGYESLPMPIKQGMLEHLAKIYDQRGMDQALPLSVKSLYQSYKRVRL